MKDTKNQIEVQRNWMKSIFAEMEDVHSDQRLGKAKPNLEKPLPEDAQLIPLVPLKEFKGFEQDLVSAIKKRRSRRKFSEESISLAELSFLLWCTHGIRRTVMMENQPYCTMRTVPSAGARHPFETYLIVHNVKSLTSGVYRYIATQQALIFLHSDENLKHKITEATLGQSFSGNSAVVFAWSCLPYRAEWRYSIAAHKAMLLDAGHICQNLYLACEVIQAGTCAIAAYDQKKMDDLLKLDGKSEFCVYLAPVGKK